MRKRLIEKFTKAKEGSFGYTMTELLVVVAIIAIVAAIAIPSVIAISRALKFKRVNDHAKSIFLAAQQNLTEMRSDGGLKPLQVTNVNSLPVQEGQSGFPAEHWSDEYVYTASDLPTAGEQRNTYDIVLPVGSIEGTVRDQQVIIEYNPITGNVYSVFYSEEDESILSAYQSETGLPRDDKVARKDMMLGYYDGSGLSSSELELEKTAAEVVFDNGEEGIVTVKVPIPSLYYDKHAEFREGLKVDLTLTGENEGGTVSVNIKESGTLPDNCTLDIDGKTVLITFVLDSLHDCRSFANLSTGTSSMDVTDDSGIQTAADTGAATSAKHITELGLTDFKKDANLSDGDTGNILPGDNITIDAYVEFVNTGSNPAVTIEDGTLAAVNPMYEYLEPSATNPDKYILAVSNGRNLQNLNAIHPDIASKVESVIFTSDIYWNRTVGYYNEEHGEIPNNGTAKVYQNSAAEAPARSLPYFVPIHNAQLFGTARFGYPNSGDGLQDWIESGLSFILGGSFTYNNKVPTLTDGADRVKHATISGYNAENAVDGNVAKVYYLNIDATKYAIAAADIVRTSNYYAAKGQLVDSDYYDFTGLFGYVNTTIDNLEVVNPIVKGKPVTATNNPTAGALFGTGGYNTLVTNCGVYIDTKDSNFSRAAMTQSAYNPDVNQTWYGVSGEGAVGGLGGYAKCHRTVSGKLTNDPKHLAFSGCFAAVNVSGNMRRGNSDYLYGYSNGVGGFIGNSELTNFYNCYASGNVIGSGYYVTGTVDGSAYQYLNLYHSGKESYGVGGFVGTSHGTRYTNCFSTGDVSGPDGVSNTGYSGAGGFVGIMTYDENTAYGHKSEVAVSQRTVFENCYAVGLCNTDAGYAENFSGANARINISYGVIKSWSTGDYYKLLAPHYFLYGEKPDYNTYYIFKDSYYLSQYGEDASQDNSNKCSNTASYDTLANLHNLYNSLDWVSGENGQIENIKTYQLTGDAVQVVLKLVFEDINWGTALEKRDIYQQILTADKPNYNLYFLMAKLPTPEVNLEGIYKHEYMGCNASGFCGGTCTPIEKGGFPEDEWHSATAATTHSYALNGAGSVYPFSKLVGMDYYGDWPSKPLSGGLAYYETYSDGTNGFYFDREVTSTLRNDKTIVSDGYAILSSSAGNVTVSINDEASFVVNASTNAVSLGSVNRPGANSYHVAVLPEEVILPYIDETKFFNKIEATIPGLNDKGETVYATYTMYFNPNVALTQVNPTNGTTATKPESVDDIYIRTARQFANIGTMENFWTKDYNYVQLLDIDSTDYQWNVGGATQTNVKKETSPIGTEEKPFNGTYTSVGAYVTKPMLAGFKPGQTDDNAVRGLFGVVGTTGQISGLNVAVQAETLAGSSTDGAILAAVNKGTISNVTVTVNGAGTLRLQTAPAQNAPKNAQANVGLLVGRMEGTETAPAELENCSVVANCKVSLTGDNAGGVVGSAQNAVITGSYAALANGFEATADCAGGFAGELTNCKVTGSKQVDEVTIAGMSATADFIGGFAGTVSGGTVTSVNAKVNGNVVGIAPAAAEGKEVNGYVAGLVGNADEEAVFAEANVSFTGKISGKHAAGIFGKLTDVTVSNTNVTISGIVEGEDSAAGFAAAVVASSNQKKEIAASGVTLTGKISASGGRAAGFAVDFGGYANGVSVKLGTYTEAKVATKSEISAKTEAAGFACTVTGEVGGASVAGATEIKADKAAGFAIASEGTGRIAASYVTPAHSNTAANYLGNTNDNLTINGTTAAAGFVLDVAKGSTSTAGVYNSYMLGQVSGGTPYGFVGSNAGNIDGCTANVNISGGYAFVGSNTGTVLNSYGWYGDGEEAANTTVKLDSGSFTSCYFVDMDIQELEESQTTNVVLYTKKGVCKDIATSDLAENGILSDLNGDTVKWFSSGTFDSYPYRTMNPPDYRFPMLRAHYGNWITPPQYAYGIGYYEIYADAENPVSYRLVDVTNPEITVEDESLSRTVGTFDNSKPFAQPTDTEKGYGYFVFCKTGKNPFGEGLVGEEFKLIPTAGINPTKQDEGGNTVEVKRYTFYRLNATDELTVEGYTVVPYYGNAIHKSDATGVVYELRTEEHLDNIGEKPEATFSQTHTIAAADFNTVVDTFSGTLTAADGCVLTVADGSKSWMTNVSGSGTVDVDLTKVGAVTAPVFGTVSGSVTLGNIETPSIGENGALVNEVAGTVSTGAITVGTKDADGNLIPGAVSGKLFGNVSGTGVTVHGAIRTGDIKQIFGTVGASVTVDGAITAGNLTANTNAIGAVSANLTLHGLSVGEVPADTFMIESIGGGTVSTGAVSVKTVNGQVFGPISVDTVTVGSVTTNGHDINGKIFGNVGTGLTVSNGITTSDGKTTPSYGAVNGQVFGDITLAKGETVDVNGITVGNIAPGKSVIASIGVTNANAGTVKTGAVRTQMVGSVTTTTEGEGESATTNTIVNTANIFGDINGGTVTVASVTTNGQPVYGNVFGEINGTVNVGTVDTAGKFTGGPITTGAVTGNVFGDITSGTVTSGTITTGALSGNVFGDVSANVTTESITAGAVTGDIFGNISNSKDANGNTVTTTVTTGKIKVASLSGKLAGDITGTLQGSASEAKAIDLGTTTLGTNLVTSVGSSGILKNYSISGITTMTAPLVGGDLAGTLSNVDVTAGSAEVEGAILVKTVALGATVENCDVSVTGEVKASGTTVSGIDASIFGGIAANNAGTLTGNTVDISKLTATGKDNTLTVVGGIAAVNSGTTTDGTLTGGIISGGSATVNVTYTQTSTDMVGIGGLVGWMKGGSIANATANGSILLGGTGSKAEGRNMYFIGGAIAYDEGATYTGVTSNVTVGSNWAGAELTVDGIEFYNTGAGSTGMFVGAVTDGNFTNCSSTVKSGYQFLGEIQVKSNILDASKSIWFSNTSDKAEAAVTVDFAEGQTVGDYSGKGYTRLASDFSYNTYDATLSNCTFVYSDEKTYNQKIVVDDYFYLGTEEKVDKYAATRVNALTSFEAANISYGNFGTDTGKGIKTNYYVDVDGNKLPVYANIEYSNRNYSYTLYYGDNNYFHTNNSVGRYPSWVEYSDSTYPMYQQVSSFPNSDIEQMYMIVYNGYAMGANSNSVAFKSEFEKTADADLYNAIWLTTGSGTKWMNLSNNGRFVYIGDDIATGTSEQAITVTSVSNSTSLFTLSAIDGRTTYYLWYDRGFDGTWYGPYAGQFEIHQVTYNGAKWEASFALQNNLYSEQILPVLPAATAISEETIPAEEIGGETGNNT